MTTNSNAPTKSSATLPKNWPATVQTSMLHVIGLAKFAIVNGRGWTANSPSAAVRLKAEYDRLKEENALLREELRIKDARMARIDSHHRPQYRPCERMAVLALKTARSWSLESTSRAMHVSSATVASWLQRLDEKGPKPLVQLPVPVNKYPQFVKHAVTRLKTLCPTMGKVKMAQTLARAGLHLGATTVGRMLNDGEGTVKAPPTADNNPSSGKTEGPRVVTAKYPNHVWHIDLTAIPTGLGFWCTWLPFALPQKWPFCYWLAVAVDHYSRRAMGASAFMEQPKSIAVRAFLGRTMAKAKPKYIICDRGKQFDCAGFRDWCRRKGIRPPRYGAIGQHGSIAVVERFILTLKCILSCMLLVPYRREALQRELDMILGWYNAHRPHMTLKGQTPNEVYNAAFPSYRRPRFEPRSRWPRGSPCARPWALVRGLTGAKLELAVRFQSGRKHLPMVTLARAA